MKIRQRRYNIELKPKQRKLNVGFIVKLAVVVAVIIAAICLINYAVERTNIRSSYLAGRETITIGIRTDVYPFGFVDENGEIDGFDRDVTETLFRNIFGDDVEISYTSLWSENAGSSIKYGQVDFAAGLLVAGTDKTTGFAMTDPYYTDYAVAVTKGAAVNSGSDLSDMRIGVLNSMINMSTIEDYLSSEGTEVKEILRYYDFDSARDDLADGKIDALIIPRALANQYFSDEYTINASDLFPVEYSIMFQSSASAIAGVFSGEIANIKSDGTLDEIMKKWSLSD